MPPVPVNLPERLGTVVAFVATMILIAMVFGAVLQLFRENLLALVLALVIVLAAAMTVIYVFVGLMTFKGKRRKTKFKEY